jgi:hypothetical protein
MSPLFLFEVKHNYPNYYALKTLFTSKDSAVGGSFIANLMKLIPTYTDTLIGRYISGTAYGLQWIISLLVLVPLVWVAIKKLKGQRLRWPYLALAIYLFVGLLGLSFYKNDIYDHYIAFLSPAPFLLLGALGEMLWRKVEGKWRMVERCALSVYVLIIVAVLFSMVQRSPLWTPPNNQLLRTQMVAKEVLDDTQGKPYNFALIAKSNYDSAYQFYLEQYGRKPGQLPFEKADQLFVVCEDEVCQPINNPKYEIAAFGMSKIEWERDVNGVKLFKLIANPEGRAP